MSDSGEKAHWIQAHVRLKPKPPLVGPRFIVQQVEGRQVTIAMASDNRFRQVRDLSHVLRDFEPDAA